MKRARRGGIFRFLTTWRMRNERVHVRIKLSGHGNAIGFNTFRHSWLKSQTVGKMTGKKGQPTNHSRTVCAISAEECQHFSGFWSLFGTGNTHTHILRKKEMVYYVKDCIFFSLYAFPTFPAFLTLINGHSVRGSREVKLITLIDFEANKPKTHTHTHKNTARDLSDIRLECKKYWLSKIPAYAHIVPWMAASHLWE